MDYNKIYNNLCNSRKVRGITRGKGYEIHHIIPRSLGGSDDQDNLVKLTYREHYLAHKLLLKIYYGTEHYSKMNSAIWIMSTRLTKNSVYNELKNSREFEKAKQSYYVNGFLNVKKANSCGENIFKNYKREYFNARVLQCMAAKIPKMYTTKICRYFGIEKIDFKLHNRLPILYSLVMLGFQGVACLGSTEINCMTRLGVFHHTKLKNGVNSLLFTDEFLSVCGKIKQKPMTTRLFRFLAEGNMKQQFIYRYVYSWNVHNSDKLLGVFTHKCGKVVIAAMSNWALMLPDYSKWLDCELNEVPDFLKESYDRLELGKDTSTKKVSQ